MGIASRVKTIKPQFDLQRPISWSALSCFSNPDYPEYSDPHKWYERYVLKIKEAPSQELIFGSKIDKLIQADPTFLPELERFPNMQFTMNPTYRYKKFLNAEKTDYIRYSIPLIGYADGWDHAGLRLKDDKTGRTPWTQERADKTGQLTMYLFMIHLQHGIMPESVKCQIDWMPTEKDADGIIHLVEPCKVQTFHTKRTMQDILKFANYIERTVEAMKEYAKNHE